jgi:ABC-2 type transport system permease protein
MVLPRFAWRRLFRQRLVVMLMAVALIWPILCAIFIYLSNHADLILGSSKQFQSFIEVNGNFFIVFMNVQAVFAVFLAALIGPGLIAPDLTNNALQLYFSRPLNRLEYALARLTTLFGMLSLITWTPGLILFFMQGSIAGGEWFRTNWRLGAGMLAGFVLWILVVSLVALAGSAYARLKVVSGGLVLGFFFILGGVSGIVNQVLRVSWGHAVSPTWAARRIWCALLEVEPAAGPGAAASAFVLVLILLLLAFVVARKLRPVEVIS